MLNYKLNKLSERQLTVIARDFSTNINVILVWPTSCTPAVGGLFVCV